MTQQPGRPSPRDSEAERRSGADAKPAVGERQLDTVHDSDAQPGAATAEAIDRATASVGHDDGKR